ncbi:MAG: hypothetical protein QOF51_2338, partial [Chloroflexota bacterium]|nr:hypothetical protein [Chloroflexota bacterium]
MKTPVPSLSIAGQRPRRAAWLFILCAAVACSAPTAAAPSTAGGAGQGGSTVQPKTVTYGTLAPGWGDALNIVATQKGYYADEKLTVDMIYTGQSALVCQQLLAKAIDLGGCSMNDMIQAVVTGGAPLEIVMGT